MTEGRLSKWLVKAGDSVRSGDVIAEIETDKATMEVGAVEEGIVGEITVAEGSEGVAVGAVIARLLEEGETVLPEEEDAVAQSSALAPSAQTFSADLAVAEPVAIPSSVLPLPPEPEWDGATKTQTVREALRDALVLRLKARAPVDLVVGKGQLGAPMLHGHVEIVLAGQQLERQRAELRLDLICLVHHCADAR